MIVRIARVKVGHCQALTQNPVAAAAGFFYCRCGYDGIMSVHISLLAWLPSLAYLMLWVPALHGLRRPPSALAWGRSWQAACLFLATALHAILLFEQMYGQGRPQVGFALVLSATALSCLLCFMWGGLFERIEALRVVLLPVAAFVALLPLFFDSRPAQGIENALVFVLHLSAALLAYGALAFAVALALVMALLDRVLHRPKSEKKSPLYIKEILMLSPPLLSLERLMFRVIGVAFTLLTLTLASGVIFAEALRLSLRLDHKILFSVLSWGILAALLWGHKQYGWRGRTALAYVLAGFLMLMLAYVGTQFVLQIILHR
jgi:ABC-type uncharacterized transport system permease subunit